MRLIECRQVRLTIFLLFLAVQGDAQKSGGLSAVVTQIDGQVTLSSEGRAQFRSVRLAMRRQILRQEEIVHIPSGARLTLVCSTDRLVSLTGKQDWSLDPTGCEQGRLLPRNSYRNLASYRGRILPRNGSLLLEFEPRTVDLGLTPILLSPRNTATLVAYPRFVWTQVADASEYKITLRGSVDMSIRLARADLQCGEGTGPWRALAVCYWTASGKWPPLEGEKPVSIRLSSSQTMTSSLPQIEETQVRLLSVVDQKKTQEILDQIANLPLSRADQLLLTAGIYAEAGLYADAIVTYDEALDFQEIPEVRVTLGDLYSSIGLIMLAEREYRQALADAPDSAARAAAEFGLGQTAYCRRLLSEARAHFEQSQKLYASLGLLAEAEEAGAAAAHL